MAVEGDTLIHGHQCSVITRQYLGGNGDKQYVYEENNKVYWYNATLDAFTTLYDFDAEEGESWICHIDSCSYEVTVQSVEQVTWGGRTYRVQNVASVEGEFYERIIEGIGSVKGLFPYPYACVGDIYCGPYPDYLRFTTKAIWSVMPSCLGNILAGTVLWPRPMMVETARRKTPIRLPLRSSWLCSHNKPTTAQAVMPITCLLMTSA